MSISLFNSVLSLLLYFALTRYGVNAKDLKEIKSRSDGFPNNPVISLEDFLKELHSDPNFKIKQSYLGPHFKLHNDHVKFNCVDLFQSVLSDNSMKKECVMTSEFHSKYSMDGLAVGNVNCLPPIELQNGSNNTWIWTKETVENNADRFSSCGAYGNSACEETSVKYNEYIKDKVGMVLGTQVPWAEAGLLTYGAKEVITVEYNKIDSSHPQVKTIHPTEVAKSYIETPHKFQKVDFILTFSSLEHDGLGRYVHTQHAALFIYYSQLALTVNNRSVLYNVVDMAIL